jgi:hypothetical protein
MRVLPAPHRELQCDSRSALAHTDGLLSKASLMALFRARKPFPRPGLAGWDLPNAT